MEAVLFHSSLEMALSKELYHLLLVVTITELLDGGDRLRVLMSRTPRNAEIEISPAKKASVVN